jgi:hypothetical protein
MYILLLNYRSSESYAENMTFTFIGDKVFSSVFNNALDSLRIPPGIKRNINVHFILFIPIFPTKKSLKTRKNTLNPYYNIMVHIGPLGWSLTIDEKKKNL